MGKITDQELQQINEIKEETTKIVYSLGELQYQRATIEILESDLKDKIKESKAKESKLLNDLKEKYGNVSINIETGEF
jgi:septal ring factor EnvC (AmiA/AmiB activator)